jgi:hypothetical protein
MITPKTSIQLNNSHAQILDNVCMSCINTRDAINKVQSTGLDVGEYHAQNDAQEKMARALKAAFFPQNS